jgi:hypothetical protein
MGFLLFIIATVLWLPLTLINFAFVGVKYGLSNRYFRETALDIDRFGNRNFRTLFNAALQKNGYQFGNVNETISSALGKNQLQNTLTKAGRGLVWILDKIEPNHCLNAIGE